MLWLQWCYMNVFDKTHQTVHQQRVNLIVCKLYLNKPKLELKNNQIKKTYYDISSWVSKKSNSFTRMLEMMLEKQAHIHNSQGKMVQPLCREIRQLHITLITYYKRKLHWRLSIDLVVLFLVTYCCLSPASSTR